MEKPDFLASALKLAAMGFHVFPLRENSKLPAIKDFPNLATTNAEKITAWWTERPNCNVGISTTFYNGGNSGLIVVDVDNKGEKKGNDEVLKLELCGKEFPPTITQRTPTGGLHYLYRTKIAVKQSAGRIAQGIDTRSKGGYIVGAGSVLDGRLYTFENEKAPLAETPPWLLQSSPDREAPADKSVSPRIDQKRAYASASDWIRSAPLAVQGANGDHTTFAVACQIKDFGLPEKECFALLTEQDGWNDRCSPPWDLVDLRTKVRNAYSYGGSAVGVDAPESQFSVIEDPVPAPVPPQSTTLAGSYLEQINKNFALVYVDGGHFILQNTVAEDGSPATRYLAEVTFKRLFSARTVQETAKGKPKSWAEMWLDWPGRREYKGIHFAPEIPARNGYYNTWTGFSAKATPYSRATSQAQRGFNMFMEHSLKNICNEDVDLHTWLMSYFAHMVQKPWERPLTTLVFRGRKGTGKNALIDRIGEILGNEHYLVAHNSRYLTSNFNGHLEGCLCLVLDEAFWSGDKTAEGILKGLTTAPTIPIERKGREIYKVKNLARLIVIGNEDWLVPASSDERRYAVFDIGEGRMRDNEFFEEMRILMDSRGGNGVLLDYLKTFDLTQADYNRAPETKALYDQKVSSQTPFYDWWLECLDEGRIVGSDFGNEWTQDIGKESLRQAFNRYCTDRKISGRMPSRTATAKMLKKCAPTVEFDKKLRQGDKTIWIYRLPSLEDARKQWDERMNHKTEWAEV